MRTQSRSEGGSSTAASAAGGCCDSGRKALPLLLPPMPLLPELAAAPPAPAPPAGCSCAAAAASNARALSSSAGGAAEYSQSSWFSCSDCGEPGTAHAYQEMLTTRCGRARTHSHQPAQRAPPTAPPLRDATQAALQGQTSSPPRTHKQPSKDTQAAIQGQNALERTRVSLPDRYLQAVTA
jgi:hypothetical protein